MGMLCLLKASLWGNSIKTVTEEDFEEMKTHAVAGIPADLISRVDMDAKLRNEWKKYIISSLAYNANYVYLQERLPIYVPYVILKGTTAAQYYPNPMYRTMGDIDIMTRREDYDIACRSLVENGFKEHINKSEEDFGRHRGFSKNGIVVEVHAFFALLNNSHQSQYLDDIIIQNINPSHILPDMINGLVLLEHIAQHMEGGLGIRQIIDWMMFVDKCLPDEQWYEFKDMAYNIGLEKLAIVLTRMCEIYLNLSPHQWCNNASNDICKCLMDYVLNSGNFGKKRNLENHSGINTFTYARNPIAFFRLLQERGMANWKLTKKYWLLRPFAWVYQLGRYMYKGLGRKKPINELKEEYKIARKRLVLFDYLGVKQVSKGLAIYKNGKYIKTFKRP